MMKIKRPQWLTANNIGVWLIVGLILFVVCGMLVPAMAVLGYAIYAH